ncbi:Alpha/Beta hydrolase protein, partial [Lophiotrema nucula]
NFWQHFLAPYNLALHGYVVVATDYAGLGVSKTASGEPIVHEYVAEPSQANDVIYSVQAAQQAFPQLGKRFVVIGNSQGGGAAWSIAQRQVDKPIHDYLGGVAVAPVTRILRDAEPIRSYLALAMVSGVAAYFPEFNESDVCTPKGLQRAALVRQLESPTSIMIALVSGVKLQDNWAVNHYIQKYQALILNGGTAIANPLLVVKSEADPVLQYSVAAAAVHDTLEKFPQSLIEFMQMPGVSHGPALTSSQRH